MYLQPNDPVVQQVRCVRCQKPLWQRYQGNVAYTLHIEGEQRVKHVVSGYAYGEPGDRSEVVACPGCGVVLSPAMVTLVPAVRSFVIHEKPARRSSGRGRR